MNIQVVHEGKRGCGYRKVGGLYLRSDGPTMACGRLPIPLTVCPCCNHGFKPSRGWTWVNADEIIEASGKECDMDKSNCAVCPIGRALEGKLGMAGLLWIGEQHYHTPDDFTQEASEMGISRRIHSVPRDFKLGETWVLLAHRKAIKVLSEDGLAKYVPAIFRVFKPSRIEIVCDGTETDEVIDGYIKRGLTPVIVDNSLAEVEVER